MYFRFGLTATGSKNTIRHPSNFSIHSRDLARTHVKLAFFTSREQNIGTIEKLEHNRQDTLIAGCEVTSNPIDTNV